MKSRKTIIKETIKLVEKKLLLDLEIMLKERELLKGLNQELKQS